MLALSVEIGVGIISYINALDARGWKYQPFHRYAIAKESETVNYDTWATLNDEGMKWFGEVFPDGYVPIRSIVEEKAILSDKEQDIYEVEWKLLTCDQQEKLAKILSKLFKRNPTEIKGVIELAGFLPLRRTLTKGSGTKRLEMFI